MNPLFRIDFSISDSLKIVRKSVLIYETIILYGNQCHYDPHCADGSKGNHGASYGSYADCLQLCDVQYH